MEFVKLIPTTSENWFFDCTALILQWKEFNFGFNAKIIAIINDNQNQVKFSFDGITVHGILKAEEALEISEISKHKIYLNGNGDIRIWAY